MALPATQANTLKQRLTVDIISRMQPNNLMRIFYRCNKFGFIANECRGALTNAQLKAFLQRFGAHRSGMVKYELVEAVQQELEKYFG